MWNVAVMIGAKGGFCIGFRFFSFGLGIGYFSFRWARCNVYGRRDLWPSFAEVALAFEVYIFILGWW